MLHIRPQDRLSIISQYIPTDPIIVEAGAFQGQDTLRMAHQWPNATIYAFEPVPELFEQLQSQTIGYPHIHPRPYALATSVGQATFWPSEHPRRPGKHSQAGSLLAPKERTSWSPIRFNDPITVATTTLDAWAAQEKIDRVDLLWLDMQGYELPALQAGLTLLPSVRAIWTEVHFIQAYEGIAQYDEVTQWLQHHGFILIGTDFLNTTDWFFGTALFVRK